MTTRTEMIEEFYKNFETHNRDDGESIIVLLKDAPEWQYKVVRTAHFDKLPNNWSYRMIRDCVAHMCDYLDDENPHESIQRATAELDQCIPDYTGELINWAGSHLDRWNSISSAMREHSHVRDVTQVTRIAYREELERVWWTLVVDFAGHYTREVINHDAA